MDVLFHSLFVWPIESLVEILFAFFAKATQHDVGTVIILLSLAVNSLVLPIYQVADRWQAEVAGLQARMKDTVARIRKTFRGDERQLILATYHRQMGYKPSLALRSSFGLVLQIPFFLAAYAFLSHAPGIQGVAFWGIPDLGKPDGLLDIGGFRVNLLPLVMTALNLASAGLYTWGLPWKDRSGLILVALVFLVLLYTSPAGMVLYWTVSNLFSLLKNLMRFVPSAGRVVQGVLALALLAAAWKVGSTDLSFPSLRMIALIACFLMVFLLPWGWSRLSRLLAQVDPPQVLQERRQLILAGSTLFALSGLAIPVLLVQSSPVEFGTVSSLILSSLVQSFSVYLLIPMGLWTIGTPAVRRVLAWGLSFSALLALGSAFLLPPSATMNASFTFVDPQALSRAVQPIGSVALVAAVLLVTVLAVLFRKGAWLTGFLGLTAGSLVLVSAVSWISMPELKPGEAVKTVDRVDPQFVLSRTSQNQVLLFLDGFTSTAFPKALEEVPRLRESLAGFVWYQNTVSFAPMTLFNIGAVVGGYEYAPEAANARKGISLLQKNQEAWRLLPTLFARAGARVFVTDPSLANLSVVPDTSIFRDIPGVQATNLAGRYRQLYLRRNGFEADVPLEKHYEYDILFRFSVLRSSLPILRPILYSEGSWWREGDSAAFSKDMETYPILSLLPELCQVDDGPGSLMMTFTESNHDIGGYAADRKPCNRFVVVAPEDIRRYGDIPSAQYNYGFQAGLSAVAHWLDWLKSQGIYDNTRIVIVADHGKPLASQPFAQYRPLLLVKDVGVAEPFQVSDEFMTNADVPALLTKGMADARNPATGVSLAGNWKSRLPVIHEGPFLPQGQLPDQYVFTSSTYLRRPDSTLAENWEVGR